MKMPKPKLPKAPKPSTGGAAFPSGKFAFGGSSTMKAPDQAVLAALKG